ncbi:uncharacterized protein LOC142096118 [Mixophyes fleayi]|uniref:uncharacterized protein LOC142096118 n=1 Tax=Mixophyes fleayi TaxID=3061075 RepID=UPI003F4D93AC
MRVSDLPKNLLAVDSCKFQPMSAGRGWDLYTVISQCAEASALPASGFLRARLKYQGPGVSTSLQPPNPAGVTARAAVQTEVASENQASSAGIPLGVLSVPESQQVAMETSVVPGPSGAAESGRQSAAGAGDGRSGLRFLAEASLAPSTWKAYRAAWKRWEVFLLSGPDRSSGDSNGMIDFMWGCYQEGLSRTSMTAMLAGISFMAKLQSVPDLTKSFLISKALKGWSRLHPTPKDRRKPIDPILLSRMIFTLPDITSDHFEASLFAAAFSLAFHGAMRVSELVAQSKSRTDASLLGKHVVLSDDSIQVKIRRSKTDQAGIGHWFTLSKIQDQSICPVKICKYFSSIRPHGSEVWLVHEDLSPLTKFQFHAVMCNTLNALGLNSSEFGTHSFRIGAATAAAASGASVTSIQRLGRWKSGCYKSYIRPDV